MEGSRFGPYRTKPAKFITARRVVGKFLKQAAPGNGPELGGSTVTAQPKTDEPKPLGKTSLWVIPGSRLLPHPPVVHVSTRIRLALHERVKAAPLQALLLPISLLNQGSDHIDIRRGNQAYTRILVQTGDKILLG